MTSAPSRDPRAIQTRSALEGAFRKLLKIKSYQRITVTDITKQAGIARHTFYNHYETKGELLDSLIDSILEEFFLNLENWNLFLADQAEQQAMLTSFFKTWRDHSRIVELLKSVDIEFVIMERLKAFFTRFFYEKVKREMPEVDLALAKYVISFNSYSLLGILIPWFDSGMKHSPEDLAGFYGQLSNSAQRMNAIQTYKDIFR
jgi:AcrR family transcriptional regulator